MQEMYDNFKSSLGRIYQTVFKSRYTWGTPIRKILGSEFKLYTRFLTENVNLRDVLGHKTGIPDYFLPLVGALPDHLTRKDLVR